MSAGREELVATDEPAVVPESLLDPIVVEDGQGDRSLPDPPCTNEGDWSEILCETNDLFDELVASETDPRRWGR